MKKILISFLILFFAVAFVRIGTSIYENIRRRSDGQHILVNQKITAKEAEKLCYTVMGKQDETTGFPFSFGVTNIIEKDGKEYYTIRASWLVNNSHMSYIGDFFVSVDGQEIYTGIVQDDEYTIDELIWSNQN
ncbi:MAG: hypothetical protein E7398_05310 [Ruminococcaceae bacterium]|nr:hypothetical protein [Oscillospiraceae bacterium]